MNIDFLRNFEMKTREIQTPFLALDLNMVKVNYKKIVTVFDFADIFYAIKANYDKSILELLDKENAKFEVGSLGELDKLEQLGVAPSRIIISNPLKEPAFIRAAYKYGIEVFAFDSMYELDKLAKFAPKSKVFVRIEVSNKGSDWPLTGKFGVQPRDALDLMEHAKQMGLNPYGVIFHVGSQCLNPESWNDALTHVKDIFKSLKSAGINLKAINLGGGLPVENTKKIPSFDLIASNIRAFIKRNFPSSTQVIMEPGRAVVGNAGFLVSTVIARAVRHDKNWVSLDLGVFNGLVDSLGGFEWKYETTKEGPLKNFILAGPSCDSADKIATSVDLPDIQIGDRIYIPNSAAYTTVYASDFDGFRIPKIVLME